ncbi:MAG: AAA family ATPase [Phycisphaerae bacterium]|nr:AAA family ATPase [Phycisphaerae bacterium]
MRTIAVINQKGGCGKTTISINLAAALATKGKQTLLVDMDPQGHCAVGLAVPEEQIEQSTYDVLIGAGRGEPMRLREILWQISDRFELAPSNIDLAAFEQQMGGVDNRENCLRKVLDEIQDEYDYVVIDCPPSVGLLTFNALRAATDVMVPVEMGYFSLHGLSRQLETLTAFCEQCKQNINVTVLASMYDIRTKMGREILAELKKHFSERMFKTVVNFNTKLKEAASLGQPICEYDPSCKGFKDFLSLADELIGSDTQIHRANLVNSLQAKLDKISASADELLADTPAPKPQKQQQPIVSCDEKLADFYGVRQLDGHVVFSTIYPRAQQVQIAGDFNEWKPENAALDRVDEKGKWQLTMPLNKGLYRYRLVVDGQWQQDPYNDWIEMNPFGEFNSVLNVE